MCTLQDSLNLAIGDDVYYDDYSFSGTGKIYEIEDIYNVSGEIVNRFFWVENFKGGHSLNFIYVDKMGD